VKFKLVGISVSAIGNVGDDTPAILICYIRKAHECIIVVFTILVMSYDSLTLKSTLASF
jgi:hypothetical protein